MEVESSQSDFLQQEDGSQVLLPAQRFPFATCRFGCLMQCSVVTDILNIGLGVVWFFIFSNFTDPCSWAELL